MRFGKTAILGVVGGLCIANAASAVPIGGLGVPSDVIISGTVADFESVAADVFPTSSATTKLGEPNYSDPRVGARTTETTGGLTVSGYDTVAGAAAPIYFSPEVTLAYQTDVDTTVFNFEPYVGPEDFNTSGNALFNWYKKRTSATTGGIAIFQQVHANQFRFDLATTVNAFGFNFGANDSIWTLAAYDADDNLLDSYDIGFVAIDEVSDGQWYGIQAAGISYVTLTDTFVQSAEAGGPCFAQIPGQVCGEWVMIDNVTYGNVSAVPVPAALPLLLAGLGGFALIRRRA